jgi:hypothetical protein
MNFFIAHLRSSCYMVNVVESTLFTEGNEMNYLELYIEKREINLSEAISIAEVRYRSGIGDYDYYYCRNIAKKLEKRNLAHKIGREWKIDRNAFMKAAEIYRAQEKYNIEEEISFARQQSLKNSNKSDNQIINQAKKKRRLSVMHRWVKTLCENLAELATEEENFTPRRMLVRALENTFSSSSVDAGNLDKPVDQQAFNVKIHTSIKLTSDMNGLRFSDQKKMNEILSPYSNYDLIEIDASSINEYTRHNVDSHLANWQAEHPSTILCVKDDVNSRSSSLDGALKIATVKQIIGLIPLYRSYDLYEKNDTEGD